MPVRTTVKFIASLSGLAALAAAGKPILYWSDDKGISKTEVPKIASSDNYILEAKDIQAMTVDESAGMIYYAVTARGETNTKLKKVKTDGSGDEDLILLGSTIAGPLFTNGEKLVYVNKDMDFRQVGTDGTGDESICNAKGVAEITIGQSTQEFDVDFPKMLAFIGKDKKVYTCKLDTLGGSPVSVGEDSKIKQPSGFAMDKMNSQFYAAEGFGAAGKILKMSYDGTGGWTEAFVLDTQDLRSYGRPNVLMIDSTNDQLYWFERGTNSYFGTFRRKLSAPNTEQLVPEEVFREPKVDQWSQAKVSAIALAWNAPGGTPADGEFTTPCSPNGRCTGYSTRENTLGKGKCMLDAEATAGFKCDCEKVYKQCVNQDTGSGEECIQDTVEEKCCFIGQNVLNKGKMQCGVYFPSCQGDCGSSSDTGAAVTASTSLFTVVLSMLALKALA